MPISPLAGQLPPSELLIDPDDLLRRYHSVHPDPAVPAQRVAFGTSGHRGSALDASFNEDHVLAMTQAICEHRKAQGIDGPLFLGMDTHGVSAAAQRNAIEVLAANGVSVVIQRGQGVTPTPAISRAILAYNRGRADHWADGIVVTPSHNPPKDGGFKYNPPNGGPADVDITKAVEDRANALLREGNKGVQRWPYERALNSGTVTQGDFIEGYVADLSSVIDLEAIRAAGLRIGVDPMGGANVHYWPAIAERYGLDVTVVNPRVDPRFSFITVDHDGKIRMDCSSPYAMAGLVALKNDYDIAFGNDADSDRHGIVTPTGGLMNPNHYLAVAIRYLFADRTDWRKDAAVGKTLVSSSIIDRVAAALGRRLMEVPVGFKWFVPGLLDGSVGFGGEESAGASFLRKDGTVWTTDKDGILLDLLAAEITAKTGRDPQVHFNEIAAEFGRPYYRRVDAPASPAQKAAFKNLTPEAVTAATLAGEPIRAKLVRAPGNGAPIGGLKVTTDNGWIAARPSGTENVYKVYAESLVSEAHLDRLLSEGQSLVGAALKDTER